MEQKKEYLKEQLVDYLEQKNINIRKNFICLNPEHGESNPSMSYDRRRNKVHCFGCGAEYDIFNLIGLDYGLNDHQEQINKACELYAVEVDVKPQPRPKALKLPKQDNVNMMNTFDYYEACEQTVHYTDYFKSRGLNDEIIRQFHLGYDAINERAIIPVTREFYLSRSVKSKNFFNPSGVAPEIFAKALKNKQGYVFVVESTICALSIIQSGGVAIALNGLNQIPKLINLIQQHNLTDLKVIISLDNDDAGQKKSQELMTQLHEMNMKAIQYNVSDEFKDPNELLIADASRLKANVAAAQDNFDDYLQSPLKEYKQKSALGYLQGFIDGISEVNTNFIPTGFENLDKVLDGGLYEGLYFIGALSSLGKTTFTLQVADQVAKQGHDVLIISLEMARNELMAKSISRNTFSVSKKFAKTTRQITTASFYQYYTEDDRACINQAIQEYATYAQHIYIEESVGETTVVKIRELIQNHIQITGNKPLVIIDYVQILRPMDVKMSDKQAVDYNVMELKRITRDFKVPIIGISSLNRMSYNQAISMSSFKESGAIEYSSDVLIGLQLKGAGTDDFDVDEAKANREREIELVILKNRNGQTGVKLDYIFTSEFNIFKE